MKAQYSYRPSNDELQRRYIDEGQHCTQIAKLCGADPKTIWAWLKEAGIPTRKRGSNPAVHFRKGERSAFAGRKHRPESIALVKASTVRDGRVPYLKNGVHWLKTSGARSGNWRGGITPERQAFYRSDEWKAACVIVWRRADARCERCSADHRLIDRKKGKFHVHHIVSFQVKALRAEPSNLALLCQPCHMFVHSKRNTAREFIRPAPDLFASIDAEKEGRAA